MDHEVDQPITATLKSRGWTMADRGADLGFADLYFNTENVKINLENEVFDNELLITFISRTEGGRVRCAVNYGDEDINPLLSILAELPDELTLDNFRDAIDLIARTYPETYAEPAGANEDDDWIKISPRA